ncbi:MAG: SgcJ/EcaC family oxidoreductase [Thermodesulfobacteriota bacterium]
MGINKTNKESEIRKLIDDWRDAMRGGDIDAIMSFYAPDIRLFDIIPPLEHKGQEAYRKIWDMCLPAFEGPIECEVRDLRITAGDDMAFSHGLYRFWGTMTDGKKMDMWARGTVCYRKLDGKWMIVHDHHSVPIDMSTNQALFDLKP